MFAIGSLIPSTAADTMAYAETMDPTYSSVFADPERTSGDWFQPAYFDSNETLISPTDTTFEGSIYVEPDTLGTWNPDASSFNDNALFNNGRSDSYSTASTFRISRNSSISEVRGSAFTPPDDSSNSTKTATPELDTPPKRKRGRPCLLRADSDSSYGESSRKSRISKRQPHNEVEKKYREGLNAELERLRMAVPTLPSWDPDCLNGPPKPSKATVLASAIDYIHKMEHERDRLRHENEVLRQNRRMASGQGFKMGGGYKDYVPWTAQSAVSFN